MRSKSSLRMVVSRRIASGATETSWAPLGAFVLGVSSGSESGACSRNPSGRRCPQNVRSPRA